MASIDLDAPLPTFPERFNLCDDFLDRNLREGRGEKVAISCGGETRTTRTGAA